MEIPRRSQRRRAVAGLVAAILLFAMLFTIGTSYFIFINNANNLANQSLVNRANSVSQRVQENLLVNSALSPSGYVEFYVNDTGGQAVNMTSLMVLSSTGTVLECDGIGLPSGQGCANTTPALPQVANVAKGAPKTGYIVTSYHWTSGSVSLKVFTAAGNVFSATYPPTGVSLAAQALSSGAIGDLYLSFSTYTFYVVASSNCPTGSGYSQYCLLTGSGNTGPGFGISASQYWYDYLAFSVTLTNLNHLQDDIILDQFSLMYQSAFYGFEHQNLISWNIANVGTASNGKIPIMNQYSPVVLPYDSPVTVYYVAQGCLSASQGPNDNSAGCDTMNNVGAVQSPVYRNGAGQAATVFLLSNGWEYAPGTYTISGLSYSGTNYGQNTPFVSTLYY